jgi:hypothetical protein
VAFSSPVFWRLRQDLLPDHPEHAGIGVYDPGAFGAVLPIAATDDSPHGWWPILLDQVGDCQAQLVVR